MSWQYSHAQAAATKAKKKNALTGLKTVQPTSNITYMAPVKVRVRKFFINVQEFKRFKSSKSLFVFLWPLVFVCCLLFQQFLRPACPGTRTEDFLNIFCEDNLTIH